MQLEGYHTHEAVICLCMALIETHDPEMHSNPILDTANKIHDPIMIFMIYLTRVAPNEGLDKGLGLGSILACLLLLNFCPYIPATCMEAYYVVPLFHLHVTC